MLWCGYYEIVPAPSGSENGTARPGMSSPAWQGGCCNSDLPCPTLSQLSSLSALHQWGHAVQMRSCWSCCHCSKVSGGTRNRACAYRISPYRVGAPALLDWHDCTSQKQKTPANSCGILSVIAPTSSHSASKTGGWRAAPVAQLKPETNVGCCVMTKSHMLLSVRALNHFVLFHPITWIHFKLWNSPFLPWLICEICHLSLWFTLCPS